MLIIYILYSLKRSLFYVGKTKNLQNRLYEHNSALSTFTKSGIPWVLIWAKKFSDLSEAEALEFKLKNLSRIRKVKFMKKYPDGIHDLELFKDLEKLIN